MGFWAQEPHAHTPPHLPRFPDGFGSNPLQAGLWLPSQREKCLFPLLLPSPPLPAGQLTATRTPLREAPPPLGHSPHVFIPQIFMEHPLGPGIQVTPSC